ncbi:unnamed protein product [Adineta ricciae]|uniref:AIG1-type G domain-containing protein n=1 Tax=Adineta ricciae TaxID=249248 RepID=A0A815UNY3_ADIRI|nr:unnamed protein product [Adineta ricciae]
MRRDLKDPDEQFGLIILGNSGAGKSFLANILLGREQFVHKFSSSSITHETEFVEINIGYYKLTIFNIPGLIEASQERIDLNKKEIDRAFALRPNSIIVFIFGQQNGRIKDEDVTAFNAINTAYPFKPESLVLVINGIPKKRPSDYEGEAIVLLQQLLKGVVVNDKNLCFLEYIDEDNQNERQHLKEKLLQIIVEHSPSKHEKQGEIETILDRLKGAQREIRTQHDQFRKERENFQKQIDESQRVLNETIANHQSETQSLQRAIERQDQILAEQRKKFEEATQNYQDELQRTRREAAESQRIYDILVEDRKATQEQIRAAQEANNLLQAKLFELASRPPAEPREGDCVIL